MFHESVDGLDITPIIRDVQQSLNKTLLPLLDKVKENI